MSLQNEKVKKFILKTQVLQYHRRNCKGLCIECGEVVDPTPPDARDSFCPYCCEESVYGSDELCQLLNEME